MLIRRIALLSVLLGIASVAVGQVARVPIPQAPVVNATSYIVIDADTGAIIAAQDPDKRVPPASLTKLMSAYVIFQYLRAEQIALDDLVTVSEKAYRTPGSRMFIEQNAKISVEDLIQGMIVQSGNDASVAMAEFIAGTEGAFAELMNNYASRLGMVSSNFRNSTGLPAEDHLTTARDIATLGQAIINEFPDYYAWYSQREFTFAGIRQENRNKLLWRDSTVDGMKTGYTDASGYCLVSTAKRNGMRLITAMMGSTSNKARTDASQALLNYGFRFYETRALYAKGDVLREARVWKGETDSVQLAVDRDIRVTLPRGSFEELDAKMELPSTLLAPLNVGDALGRLVVRHEGTTLASASIVAAGNVPAGGFWRRVSDEVSLWFE